MAENQELGLFAFTEALAGHRGCHYSELLRQGLPEADEEDAELQGYLRAVLLAYLASQNRSLFAARCLVQTVLEAHRSGVLSQPRKPCACTGMTQHDA